MPEQRTPAELALRVDSIDELFEPLDHRPPEERRLTLAVRTHLLDAWERVRKAPPRALCIYAPASERDEEAEAAARAAIRCDLQALSGRLREARPLGRRARLEVVVGIGLLLGCIAISVGLDRLSEAVLVQGAAQGVLVVGWVALWPPASYVALEAIPHQFNRGRYAELAGLDVQFVWTIRGTA
jgi:hypothetical protein